jgi:stearoyl-CoA desaturase (Delta-9 desaturase)
MEFVMASLANPAIETASESADAPRPIKGVIFGGPESRAKVREYVTLASTKWTGTFIALWWLATQPTGWVEWSCFLVTYILGIMGVVIGYHRYFTHRCFETSRPMEYFIAILAQTAAQGSALRWASDHRRHHAKTERPGDTHSPLYDSYGNRQTKKLKGLLNAHFGWCLDDTATDLEIYGKGLVDDPVIMWAHRTKWFWYVVSIVVVPALWGWFFGGTLHAILGTIFIGGFLRINVVLHAVLSVNSIGHSYGYQTYKNGHGEARNNWLLAILNLGDGWHNNHHEHPRSAFAGEKWWELDFCGGVIRVWEMLGLVWNVQRPKTAASRAIS